MGRGETRGEQGGASAPRRARRRTGSVRGHRAGDCRPFRSLYRVAARARGRVSHPAGHRTPPVTSSCDLRPRFLAPLRCRVPERAACALLVLPRPGHRKLSPPDTVKLLLPQGLSASCSLRPDNDEAAPLLPSSQLDSFPKRSAFHPSLSCLEPSVLTFWVYVACPTIWHCIYVLLGSLE